MDTIKDILSSISKLYEEERLVKLKKREAGEFFNVFNTIGLWSEEVRLHSAFIAELLNPKGSHGLGGLFLKAFLEELDLPDDYINVQRCSQNIVERVIGPVTETKGGRIDIIIEDGDHAIIIENKIYAGDQYHQLLRYHNYGKKKFPNGYKLIYLTLDGHEAESCSVGKEDYETISYENDIIEWLEKCCAIAEGKPLVQSVIKQYCDLIKQITNSDMDTKYKEKLMSVMLAPENINAVSEVIKLQDEWICAIYEKYIWNPLEEYAKLKGMKFGKDIESGESGAWLYREDWKYYGLFVWTDRKYDWCDMYIGISYYEKPNKKNKIFKKDYCQMNCLDSDEQSEGCPYGWEYLPVNIRNWGYNIIEEIINGEVDNYITRKFDEMIEEIDERKLLMP